MKLLSKTNRYYITAALIVFLIGTGVCYFLLTRIMNEEVNEQLHTKAAAIKSDLDVMETIPEHFISPGDGASIKLYCNCTPSSTPEYLRDTTIYSADAKEDLTYRKYTFYYTPKRAEKQVSTYLITIKKALFEEDDLLIAIGKAMFFLFALLLLVMFEVNRRISKKLWKPFYESISRVEEFTVSQGDVLIFSPSGIQEFDELNHVLYEMTRKISEDYHSLKDFSENASHEIQTPLAIIKTKLELLMQAEGLKEAQLKLISDAYESAGRLSKLNQALILLTRIGNKQFSETKIVKFDELIRARLTHFKELIDHKGLVLDLNLQGGPEKEMNPALADILLSNLLGNAIKHNHPGGNMTIRTNKDEISISNTGVSVAQDPTHFFERFRKGDASSDSLGLGLAIVKQICEESGIVASYSYQEGIHTLLLKFQSASS